MINYIFDLDGVLIDTKLAVKEAYKRVGVNMPEDAWGKPYEEWCSHEEHELKKEVYPQFVDFLATELPMLGVAKDLDLLPNCNVMILTGASASAVELLQSKFCFQKLRILCWGANTDTKLKCLASLPSGGVYFEDNPSIAKVMREELNRHSLPWRIVCLSSF